MVQALIWLGAVAAVAVIAAVAWRAGSRSVEPERPRPRPVETPEPELAKRAAAPAPEPPGPVIEPEQPAPRDAPEPSPTTELTEARFIEVSAKLVLAGEWVAEAEESQETLEQITDDILAREGVDRGEFERLVDEIAEDEERRERIGNQIQNRATALRISNVRIDERAEPHPRRKATPPPR
jgi:uncharacterized protein YheU (UPF0270 family)